VGVRVGVAYTRNKLALRTRLRNLNPNPHSQTTKSKSEIPVPCFDSFQDIRVHIYDFFKFVGRIVGVRVGVALC